MDPHVRAILLSLTATAVGGLALWACAAALLRRRRQARPASTALKVAAACAGLAALGAAYLALVFLGMTVNGGSCERTVVQTDGVLRSIERRDMWGRAGMCLYWNGSAQLDRERSGLFSGGRQVAAISFEPDGVGFRDAQGRCGPWLYLGPDGEPDPARTGWYDAGELALVKRSHALGPAVTLGSALPLRAPELDDLRLAWASR